MAFLAFVWAIWRHRTRIVFKGERFDEDDCHEVCRFIMAWWVKAKGGNLIPLVADLIRCSGKTSIPNKVKRRNEHWV